MSNVWDPNRSGTLVDSLAYLASSCPFEGIGFSQSQTHTENRPVKCVRITMMHRQFWQSSWHWSWLLYLRHLFWVHQISCRSDLVGLTDMLFHLNVGQCWCQDTRKSAKLPLTVGANFRISLYASIARSPYQSHSYSDLPSGCCHRCRVEHTLYCLG